LLLLKVQNTTFVIKDNILLKMLLSHAQRS